MSTNSIHSIDKLDGTNFYAWKFKIQMVLIDKEIWDVVDGSEAPPKEEKELKLWNAKDKKALATICLTVKDSELVHIRSCTSSAEAWKKLAEVYETKGLARRLYLRRKFFTAQLQDGTAMQAHINKIMMLAEQLDAIGAGVSDEDIAMTLLCSLPESYENLIIALESRADGLTSEFVRSRLLQEEARRRETGALKQDESAFLVKSSKARADGRHGEGSGLRHRDTRIKCFHCGKLGHKISECRKRLAGEKEKSQAKLASERDAAFAAKYDASTAEEDKWYVDSGATQHISSRKEWFHKYEEIPSRHIYLADGRAIVARGVGTIHVKLNVNGEERNGTLEEVLYIPDLHGNLFSVNKAVGRNFKVIFDDRGCAIENENGRIMAVAFREGNLYRLAASSQRVDDSAHLAAAASHNIALWHRRLGHLNVDSIKLLASKTLVTGLDVKKEESMNLCVGCLHGKQHRLPFPAAESRRASDILGLIHSDVCGPMKNISLGGAKYFITFIDDKTRKSFVYFLKSKDEVFEKFKEFKALVENQTGKRIKALRSDNGGEYVSNAFSKYLKAHGIHHQKTVAYTPEQNGVAERANRTIVERARSMLHAEGMGYEFWAEAVATAVYLKNLSPTKALPDMTPEEAWSGSRPSVSHLRSFGCKAYAHVPDQQRTKLDSKTTECIFLGYSIDSKAYRLFNLSTRAVIKSRDVVFDERLEEKAKDDTAIIIESESMVDEKTVLQDPSSHSSDGEISDPSQHDTIVADMERPSSQASYHSSNDESIERRRSGRDRKAPSRFMDYARLAVSNEPQTFEEAVARPDGDQWEQAARVEYDSIIKNKTWALVDLPPERKAIGCKWVFKIKYNAAGDVDRYKARLVAKGFSQTQGVDFNETFAPVAKFNSIRILLALAAQRDLEAHQMDVKTAFLNGDLEEDIYMHQPEGFIEAGQENKVCKLQRSLYGLKQAGRSWYLKIDSCFSDLGLKRTHADNCVYHLRKDGILLIVALYVDDLLIIANDMAALNNLKMELSRRFEMKDLGEVQFCLGIQITRNRPERTIRISQAKYIEDVLRKFNMHDCKAIGTPLDANTRLSKSMSPKSHEEADEMKGVPYQSAVGSLMYAMLGTRPDIGYAVGAVSQFSSDPGRGHWTAVKRIFRYLKRTKDYALQFKGSAGALIGYSDADWAGNPDDRRSTTGYAFIIAGGSVSWGSKKQSTVALSTTEAEYMAITQATKEGVWIRRLLMEIGFWGSAEQATIIYSDNQGCIALGKNPVYHARTKHIDIRHHFIREKIESHEVEVNFCRTEEMVADILTKALTKEKHDRCSRGLGLITA